MLGDHECAVGLSFDYGVTDADEVLYLTPVGVVAARALGATLGDVAGNRAGGQLVIVLRRPAKLVDHRAADERRVGDAAGNDDLGARGEALGHGERTDVGVGAEQVVLDLGQRPAVVHVLHRVAGVGQFRDAGQDVVAVDYADFEALDALLAGEFENGLQAAVGVDSAGVGDHLDALLVDCGQRAVQHLHEVRRVSRCRIPPLELLHDAHGDFREVVEG